MKKTILFVEDEESLVSYLEPELQFENYNVITARDGEQAWNLYKENKSIINLIILDWMLPKLDGLEVLRRIRRHSKVPVIMMTARDYIGDKVAGLDSGADDYITKPFDIEELLARIRVIIRHQDDQKDTSAVYQIGDLSLDTKSRQVIKNDEIIQLTQREYDLLLILLQNINDTLTREELLDKVWGINFDGQPNIVDVYIRYLRNKIDSPHHESLIQTVRGVGYVLRYENHD
ncbi:response regulator transcription factor [Companilactobacillus jidongensis]|uniref:response regulator transcription factor n=1 Tax=Companilactobacillus jidongensis TaxID=2486006 RepID=UPI000F773E5F|nr:response regulator transcription factor [Companilactobacillus jidongensis]